MKKLREMADDIEKSGDTGMEQLTPLDIAVKKILNHITAFGTEIEINQSAFANNITSQLSLFDATLKSVAQNDAQRGAEWLQFKNAVETEITNLRAQVNSQSTVNANLIDARIEAALASRHAPSTPPDAARGLEKIEEKLIACQQWVEKEEKLRRKNNIVIKGLDLPKENITTEVNNFFATQLNLPNLITDAHLISKPSSSSVILATVTTWEGKLQILRAKKNLNLPGRKIYIDPDQTPEECARDFALREQARIARRNGHKAKLVKKTIIIDDTHYTWDLYGKKLVPIPDKENSDPTSTASKNGNTDRQ